MIVTHGGLMRALLGDLLAMPGTAIQRLATPYACLSRLRVTHAAQGDMLRLVGHNIGGDDVA